MQENDIPTILKRSGEQQVEIKNIPLSSVKGFPINLSAKSPACIAYIVHGSEDSRVAITELQTGDTMLLPSTEANPADPVCAPNGNSILFRAENDLMLYDNRRKHLSLFAKGLSAEGQTPYAYSPDGQFIAFAQTESIKIVPVISITHNESQYRYELPNGASFVQLLWSYDKKTLHVLASSHRDNKTWLGNIDLMNKKVNFASASGISGLLGWDQTTRKLVVTYANSTRIGNQAAFYNSAGEIKPLHQLVEEDDAGEFVVAYRVETQESIVELGREDLGDPVRLKILKGDNFSAPWLNSFPRLSDLSLSGDGKWAVFVDGSPTEGSGAPGGHIYIVTFGSEDAMLILKADSEAYTFSSPVFCP